MANFTSFDKLLEAMSKIADSSDSKLKYDKTVIMEIVKLLDAGTGRYAVKYQGNTLEAFAANIDDKYDTGDSVYVKIPEGDFTNTKIIESKVNNKNSDEQDRNLISNTIIDIEPSWFSENIYGTIQGEPFALVSGGEVKARSVWSRDSIDEKEQEQKEMADTLLKTYNKEYDKFIIKASFMTSFLGAHIQGNYGLRLTLKLVNVENPNEPILKDYVLDTTSFTGNIYQLSSYSPQYAVFQIPKNSFLGVESLVFFQEDMETDIWVRGDEEEKIQDDNIFVKDISVNYVNILDYTQDKYFVLIDTPQGNTFHETTVKLTASPRLIYKGEELTSDSSCEVTWFKENPNIQVGSPLYNATVGCGWEIIDNNDEKVLEIKKDDVIIEQRYKVLIIYGSKKSIFTNIVTFYRDNSITGANIVRDTIGNKTYLYIENQKYKGVWYRELPDGSYINLPIVSPIGEGWTFNVFKGNYKYEDSDTKQENPIKVKDKEVTAYNKVDISDWLAYNSVTFYCDIYDEEQKYLVTRNYSITNLGEDSDVTVNFIGENVYHYDANGDIAIEESEKDRTIDGKITWREGLGTAFKVEWFDSQGNLITTSTTGKKLDNSMLRDVYIDGNNILHYKISSKYYNYYTNNNFIMKITTIEGKEYSFPCDIIFAKDGEPGTNGTTYITMIRPVDTDGKLDTTYKVLYKGNLGQYFKAYVYKDGKDITSNKDYTITYEWSEENIPFNDEKNTKNSQIIQISSMPEAPILNTDEDFYNIRGYVLKVATTIIDNTMDTKRKIVVYYNLPVAVVFCNETSNFNPEDFNTEIPNFIQYGSDGTIASYKYQALKANYKEESIDFSQSLSYATDAINIISSEKEYFLKPVNNYYYQKGSAAIKLLLPEKEYIVYTIMMYKNTFGNATINGWDGTQMKLDEKGNYLLSALVGAGEKNSNNQFTGVVMGIVKDNKNTEQNGLFAYYNGERTFFLDSETGEAHFGKNNEIILKPNEAEITGRYGANNNPSMTLKLIGEDKEDTAIKVGSNFSVDYSGKLIASSVTLSGDITATSGQIAGWEIDGDSLSNNGIILNSNGLYKQVKDWGKTGFTFNSDSLSIANGIINIGYVGGGYVTFGSNSTIDFSETDVQGLDLTAVFG